MTVGTDQPAGDVHGWASVRSDPDGRGLLVSYLGGACDLRARMTAEVTSGTVRRTLHVPNRPGDCAAIGIGRTAHVELAEPLGSRQDLDAATGATHVAFDGRLPRTPARLPADLQLRLDMGGGPSGVPGDDMWVRTWGPPPTEPAAGGHCDAAAPAGIQVATSATAADAVPAGTVSIGSATATVAREPQTGEVYLSWRDAGRGITLSSLAGCQGQQGYAVAELASTAASLH